MAGVALGDIYLRFAWQAGALGDIHLRFAWQAWRLALAALGWIRWRAWARLTAGDAAALCVGRHGAWRHPPSLRVADVALGDIYLRFAWQAWCLCHWAGSGGGLGRAWAELVAGEAAALCVAGVALGDIHLRFAWQAWHLVTSTLVLRGRRGANVSGLDSVARLGAVSRR